MRNVFYYLLFISVNFCILGACVQKQPYNVTGDGNENISNSLMEIRKESPLQKLPSPAGNIEPPKVTDFGIARVFRHSKTEDQHGRMIAPFEYAEITISLYAEPKDGDYVTVIPLQVTIEPFYVKISKSTKTIDNGCGDKKGEFYWETRLEDLTAPEILNIPPLENRVSEFPFDVLFIYPAVTFAKNVGISDLSSEMLPKSSHLETAEAAVDLNNDGEPELLVFSFCCDDETKPSVDGTCNYACGRTYRKHKSRWTLTDKYEPC